MAKKRKPDQSHTSAVYVLDDGRRFPVSTDPKRQEEEQAELARLYGAHAVTVVIGCHVDLSRAGAVGRYRSKRSRDAALAMHEEDRGISACVIRYFKEHRAEFPLHRDGKVNVLGTAKKIVAAREVPRTDVNVIRNIISKHLAKSDPTRSS